ncbi:MAG: hypothetical protein ACXAE3_06220 [Candidatus Kariarchaeaceae archaeon]|jgi:hypothetical protein
MSDESAVPETVVKVFNTVFGPINRFKYSYRKEAIAFENLILSRNYKLAILFFPILILLIDDLMSSNVGIGSTLASTLVITDQLPSLLWVRVFTLILVTAVFSYKLTKITKDGKLGYWLTLGIGRSEFILYSTIYSSLILSLSVFQVYVISSYLTAVTMSFWALLGSFFISFLFNSFIINITILLTDLVENVEISVFLLTFTYILGAYFSPEDSTIRKIFVPDYLDATVPSILIVLGLFLGSVVLYWVNTLSFQSKNVELGG